MQAWNFWDFFKVQRYLKKKIFRGSGWEIWKSIPGQKRYDFFFIVTLCSSSLENAVLSSGCSRRPGDSCSFSCAEGYIPLNSNNLVCGSDGTWNQDTNNLCSSEIKSEHEYALLHVIFAKNLNEILYWGSKPWSRFPEVT